MLCFTAENELRKEKHAAELIQKAKLQFKKDVTHNNNMTEILASSKEDLEAQLAMLDYAVGTSLSYLKRQFDARNVNPTCLVSIWACPPC
jgi:hypothetical protein